MRFVEIEGTIINIDSIKYVDKKWVSDGNVHCIIGFTSNNCLHVDEFYYNKLKDLLHPIQLIDNKEYINVNDFPGDNMIEE
jgi:hypothetical protein